jgi:hypothetical protein
MNFFGNNPQRFISIKEKNVSKRNIKDRNHMNFPITSVIGLVKMNINIKLKGNAPIIMKGNRFPHRLTRRVDLSHKCPIMGSLNIL